MTNQKAIIGSPRSLGVGGCHLEEFVRRTGDWDKADELGENIRLQVHDLISSGISEAELFPTEAKNVL